MNSHVQYFYRDGANYKAHPEEPVIVEGDLPEEEIRACLRSGEQFIPGDVGLPELQTQLEGFPSRDDHVWHELHAIEPTDAEPTLELSADDLLERFHHAHARGWNEPAARRRLGFNPYEPPAICLYHDIMIR